ncbi:MAG TPA: ankyrin repeat domain-containing protein [Pyrinomonadaceae bacterium]|nr:ankyrin repeat domain-containing protein [Pyrinomonadaceae bacterium]
MSLAAVQLLCAAASGDLYRLRTLLVQGVDVNATNKANQTALMLAAAFKRIEIVEYLVLAGADVEIQDEMGLTAVDWARHDPRITRLFNASPVSALRQQSVVQTATLGGLVGAIHRDHTSANSSFAAADEHETQPGSHSELSDTDSEEEIPPPHVPPMSPTLRTLVRVSIVALLVVGGFGAYHFVTSVLSRRTSGDSRPQPASNPVNAATKATKSAPAIGGELAGTELFLPDADYPPDATVESGNVTVGIQVSRKGVVVKAEALDGDESLRSAAEKAAWSSAFAPEKLVDKSSLIDGTISYSFSKPGDRKPEFGFSVDVETGSNVSATVGGPLAGAERKLVIPKIPKWVPVEQESATLVVRVNRSGRVMSYRPLDAEGRLRSYLIKAARASTFDPAKLPSEGQVVGTISYKFQ